VPFGFANSILLWGLAAASIPIIIHLLNRRRVRVIDWGAMRFLRDAVISRRRKIRLEELLLLLLRTAILVFLVLAMARPFLRGGLFGTGRQHRDLVVVLDCSMSMDLREGVHTPFARAVELTRQTLDNLREGDGVNVVLAGKVPRALFPELTYDLKAARDALTDLKPFRTSLDMVRSVRLADTILAGGTSPLKQVVIISDGQRFGWSADDDEAWSVLAEDPDAALRPRLHVCTVGPVTNPDNLGITRITLSRSAVGTDRDVGLSVEVANPGTRDVTGAKLKVTIDEAVKADLDVGTLRAGSSVLFPVRHQFGHTGPALVQARISDDALEPDNVAWLGLEVLDVLPVLLVDGAPGTSRAGSEVFFLRAALDPLDPQSMKRTNLIASTVESIDPMDRNELLQYAAVVLANVKSLGPAQVAALEQFVRSGGGLLIAPGDNVDLDFCNGPLFAEGRGLLPCQLDHVLGEPGSRSACVSLLTGSLTHRALALLAEPDKADVSKARFYRHWSTGRLAAGAAPIALFNDGTPFLVERSLGAGRVILMTTPLDADWSNLPLRPNYVTLMHELVYYLAAPVLPRRNLLVGENLSLELDKPDNISEVNVTGPGGATRQAAVLQREGRWFASYPHTDQGGLYKVEVVGPAQRRTVTFTVNVDPGESDLAPLSALDRTRLADRAAIRFHDSPDDLLNTVFAGSIRYEIWRIVLVLVVLMMLAEILFTRKLARRQSDSIRVGTEDGVSRRIADARRHVVKEREAADMDEVPR